ncbi:hypothetical protein SDRG_00469 [Saprolegnia diclina VS20]|uniref:Uncharacterized protein n=1 Tax=Saprolegnia diclina (strain VS20) TaxID=1156394 RepID=T0R730_SAPDV|nr:hypothetical protein SDRG_00469 [Saprolegnia diclina VS20]EQC42746.1 hypothetical protein SDRG_00469 [Saprolegnia diclina VS20]|eukprot:XP_008604169.1 hypothetical protein SDRG_00469 [Saprolegnia diclina VS20]
MKAFVILSAIAALVASSDVVVKYSAPNLVKGAEGRSGKADVLSLTRHAMESLALPEAVVPVEPLAVSADLFKHTAGYGFVVVEGAGEGFAPEKADYAFQKTMDLQEASTGQLPHLVSVLAQGVKGKNAKNVVVCVGDSVCGSVDKQFTDALSTTNAATVEASLWSALPALQSANTADQLVVRELTNLKLVIDSIKNADKSVQGLYVASISDLSGLAAEKQDAAKAVVASTVQDLQKALKEHYINAGLQVLTLSQKMKIDMVELSASVALARQLSLSANATVADKTAAAPLTIENIAEYQIILWTAVILAVVTFLAISVLCGMDANRDSLLYAKFLTDASNRKND